MRQLHGLAAVGMDAHGVGPGAPDAHGHAAVNRVGAEHAVGLVVVAGGEQGDVLLDGGHRAHGSALSTCIGATAGSSRT